MARNYAALKHEYLEEMDILTDEEFGRLCRALLAYSMDGIPIELTGMEKAYAKRVMRQEDQFQESYEKIGARNRANGGKGGRPKKTTSEETDDNPNKPTETQNNPNKPTETQITKSKSKSKSKSNISSSEDIDAHAQESTSPKVQWAEFVSMTNAEHDKLVSTYGAADTARMIEILDNYKGQNGKKYKSDYRAILNWVVERLREEKGKGVNTYGGSSASEGTGISDDPWGDLPFD